ncbi:MAG: sulfatase [Roseibacillus sp.]|nr:sulfatase [Roseibacillus sp.]HAO96256.1 sulfatase [Verrucomicrobiales bacterium]|tara:strand:- start:10902 stop:12365 length:1464 start_codon:yes stop_codon:yes gene_type:complete
MDPALEYHLHQSRRQFFQGAGLKVGGIALAQLLSQKALAKDLPTQTDIHPALPGLPHFAPKAKNLIYLHMNGAPAQQDLFDHKPQMEQFFDKELPDSVRNGQRITTMTSGQKRFPVAPSRFGFERCGQSGILMSELVPHMKGIADEITMIKSVHTEAINHDPACTFVMTGSEVPGRPSLGSWLSYGLGSESQNLPAFVVFTPTVKNPSQALFSRMWTSGFLPSKYDGVKLRSAGDPVLYVKNPPGVSSDDRRTMLDALGQLNEKSFERFGDPETQTRIAQYEMAFRMQRSVPELTDLKGESKATLEMYGPNSQRPGTFAHSALLTRRLIERGVRVVQVLHRGWDQHGNLPKEIKNQCLDVDQPTAALIKDLKERGMLEDTLVVFGGEFGRTAYCQGKLTRESYGRDHHPRNFCMWMAGGGIKAGMTYGETDDFSYNITENPVHLNELNATILHCMGIDHSRFTVRHQGLDQRLTGVEQVQPVSPILA